MEEEILLEETIKIRKKLSKKVKNTIVMFIFYNVIMVISMLIITFLINMIFNKLKISDFRMYIKYVQMAVAIISIVFFEISYRKDSGKMAIYAIEFSLYSVSVLYVTYMYVLKDKLEFLKNVVLIFTIYYLIKSCIGVVYYRHNNIKNNISDVKEIVKEERKGYIDEESVKTLKERRKKQEESKKKGENLKSKKEQKTKIKTEKKPK